MDFYVTSSIPYVNGEPHLGHALEFVMADVLARNARLRGDTVLFSTGTDEHGGKIAEYAKKAGISPKEFADRVSQQFLDIAKVLHISNNRFIRTTDQNHKEVAQKVWTSLAADIYKNQYTGWYCTGDEAFFTETVVKANNGICPAHNRPYEKIEEENYFFRLSKYTEQIKSAIETNQFKIIPETRRNEILQVLNDGLDDISISRPKDKITWGINVPDDDTQVMYVWFEALLNYISVLDYPDGEAFKAFWPADYQVIGKDIIRFHAAVWPGFLLSLNLPLPKTLFVHGFINIDGQKMSKSLGNFVSPQDIVAKYGVDAFRYYMLRHIPSYADGDFSWDKLSSAYQNELGNELGNAVQRTVVMLENYFDGDIEPSDVAVSEEINADIAACRFDRALENIWVNIKTLNQYIDTEKPWTLSKNGETEKLKTVLNQQVASLRTIAAQLKPFLPDTATKIEAMFASNKVQPLSKTLFPRIEAPEKPLTE